MKDAFTTEEKRKYMLKKHIQNHLFEYVLDFVGPIVLTLLLLYLCKAQSFTPGIVVSIAYSIGKTVSNIRHYKRDYVDRDIQ